MNGTYDSWKTSPPGGSPLEEACSSRCTGCPECQGEVVTWRFKPQSLTEVPLASSGPEDLPQKVTDEAAPATLPTGVDPEIWESMG